MKRLAPRIIGVILVLLVAIIPAEAQGGPPSQISTDCDPIEEGLVGTVKWFNPKRGYGFITVEDSADVFVHYSAIQGSGFRTLEADELVTFDLVRGKKGLSACNVIRLDTLVPDAVGDGDVISRCDPIEEDVVGTVKWFNPRKGYGFLERRIGADVFVHYSRIAGLHTLDAGERVRFDVEETPKGLSACNVTLLNG